MSTYLIRAIKMGFVKGVPVLGVPIINKLLVEMGKDMGKKTEMQPACRDYTLNLHKRLQNVQFKKRAPRAIRNIKRFATAEMYTRVSVLAIGSASRHDQIRHSAAAILTQYGDSELIKSDVNPFRVLGCAH